MKDKIWLMVSGFLAGVVVLLIAERFYSGPRVAGNTPFSSAANSAANFAANSAANSPTKSFGSRDAEKDVDPYVKGPVKNTIVKNAKNLQSCYLDLLKKNPSAGGRVTLDATIKETGAVEKSEIVRSEIESPDFQKCLTTKFAEINFPIPPRPGFYVEHTITFKKE